MENKDSAEIKNLKALVSLHASISSKKQNIFYHINSKASNINHDMKNTKVVYDGEGDNRIANLSIPHNKYIALMEFLGNVSSSEQERFSRISDSIADCFNEIKIKEEIIKTLQ